MPFTSDELSQAGKISLDRYTRKNPVDQVAVERPFLKALMAKKKTFPGAKQYIVEQLRYRYQSNFQWVNGSQVVTYNKRNTIEQANYPWRFSHDGFSLDEDRLAQNGISISDNGTAGRATDFEFERLTDILEEQNEVLRLGYEEKFSLYAHLDGTSSTDALAGLDLLVSTTPSSGTVGGIDASVSGNAFWRNSASLNTAQNVLLDTMEANWRACVKNGGRPDLILAGAAFIDDYRAAMAAAGQQINYVGGTARNLDGGIGTMYFKGVEIMWCPEFDDNFGGFVSPTPGWTKRCYFINTKHIKLRPMEGQDMVTRKPPRAYNKYEYYWGITWRGAMTADRRNAHAVIGLD